MLCITTISLVVSAQEKPITFGAVYAAIGTPGRVALFTAAGAIVSGVAATLLRRRLVRTKRLYEKAYYEEGERGERARKILERRKRWLSGSMYLARAAAAVLPAATIVLFFSELGGQIEKEKERSEVRNVSYGDYEKSWFTRLPDKRDAVHLAQAKGRSAFDNLVSLNVARTEVSFYLSGLRSSLKRHETLIGQVEQVKEKIRKRGWGGMDEDKLYEQHLPRIENDIVRIKNEIKKMEQVLKELSQ